MAASTLIYQAPELVDDEDALTLAADVYSLGIVLLELLFHEHPFMKLVGAHQVRDIRSRAEVCVQSFVIAHCCAVALSQLHLALYFQVRKYLRQENGEAVPVPDRHSGFCCGRWLPAHLRIAPLAKSVRRQSET